MPLYRYECDSCGNIDEKFRFIKSYKRAGKCSVCKKKTHFILSPVSFYGWNRFTGDGFKDAEEASGQKITSTKQIDMMEKQGIMRCIGKAKPKGR